MSTYQTEDTIAAIASTVGQAARMIVRMSGAQAREMSSQIADPGHDDAQLCRLRFSGLQCSSWIYTFHAPHSYTGEDVIEFHIPGNPLLARMLLDELIRLGARRANPGEFTARAYFNGRLDLAQAEGVASIIAANSETELRAARQLLAGELARRVKPAMDLLAETLGLVEVGIDFSEEDVEFLSSGQIQSRLSEIDTLLGDLLRDSARIERLHHTPQFVLVGRPNAGKSTLLNALAGEERAVVSPQAGTTRDALSAEVALARGMIRLIDVAGIEEKSAENEIEQQMRRRALSALETADKVILVKDSADDGAPPPTVRAPDLIVLSKSDLRRMDGLCVSARTGDNLKELRRRLDQLAFGTSTTNTLAINARHTQAIQDAREAILRARQQVSGVELLASDLRDALDALGEILGQITPDDVLGRIFSTFCIGK